MSHSERLESGSATAIAHDVPVVLKAKTQIAKRGYMTRNTPLDVDLKKSKMEEVTMSGRPNAEFKYGSTQHSFLPNVLRSTWR